MYMYIPLGALVSGAMDYERKCAELAEKQRRGKKRKKKKKDGEWASSGVVCTN